MAQEREFLKRILTAPRAKALLKEMKEPAEAEEAAAAYSAIAEKLGLSLPEDQLRAFLSSRESRSRELAEQAEKRCWMKKPWTGLPACAFRRGLFLFSSRQQRRIHHVRSYTG